MKKIQEWLEQHRAHEGHEETRASVEDDTSHAQASASEGLAYMIRRFLRELDEDESNEASGSGQASNQTHELHGSNQPSGSGQAANQSHEGHGSNEASGSGQGTAVVSLTNSEPKEKGQTTD
ncbi:hypothetical protein ACP70R_029813 [Stipagrostis hirtigluma subsp. patula]